MILPFQCPKCRNWYTPVPQLLIDEETGEKLVCLLCEEGQHAANPKTGVIDCHVGQMSATRSEMLTAMAYQAVLTAKETALQGSNELGLAAERVRVDAILTLAARAMTEVETRMAAVPEAVRWAGVFELPGMKARSNEERFKSVDVVANLVKDNRRPADDLKELRRSERVCRDLANACVNEMPLAKKALADLQEAAAAWTMPITSRGFTEVQHVSDAADLTKVVAVPKTKKARTAKQIAASRAAGKHMAEVRLAKQTVPA